MARTGEEGSPVVLHVYDLSGGMARQMSQAFLGRRIDAICCCIGIVVFGREYFYGGGMGIASALPSCTPYGRPLETVLLGRTNLPQEVFADFLEDLSLRFSPTSYSLLTNNCNNFTNEVAEFLTGNGIPAHITGLPNDVLSTPFGAMLAPLVQQFETAMGLGANVQPLHAASAPSTPSQIAPVTTTATEPVASSSIVVEPTAAVASTPIPIPSTSKDTHPGCTRHREDFALINAASTELATMNELAVRPVSTTPSLLSPPPTPPPTPASGSITPRLHFKTGSTSASPADSQIVAEFPAIAAAGPTPSGQTADAARPVKPDREDFQRAVAAEFAEIMAEGGKTANQAASLAIQRVAALQRTNSHGKSRLSS
eukprot:jgi/Chlat1/2273/Chrsp17S02576